MSYATGLDRKEVIIKDGDKYVRVPLRALYVEVEDEKDNVSENFTYPIKKFERSGDKFIVTNHIKRIHVPLRVVKRDLRDRVSHDLGISHEEYRVIDKAIQKMGGLRFKTKLGVDWEIPGRIYTGGKIDFKPEKAKVLNATNNRGLYLPNLYRNGDICWGSVSSRLKWGTNYGDGVEHFFTFIGSVFNMDLSNTDGSNNTLLRNWLSNQSENPAHPDKDVQQARMLCIQKLGSTMNVLTLQVISTIFDEDNVKIDGMIQQRR